VKLSWSFWSNISQFVKATLNLQAIVWDVGFSSKLTTRWTPRVKPILWSERVSSNAHKMIASIIFIPGVETLDAPQDHIPCGLIAGIKIIQGRGLLPLYVLNRLVSEFRPQADWWWVWNWTFGCQPFRSQRSWRHTLWFISAKNELFVYFLPGGRMRVLWGVGTVRFSEQDIFTWNIWPLSVLFATQ